jgi:hypothetical protein
MATLFSTSGGEIPPGAVNVHIDAAAARCTLTLVGPYDAWDDGTEMKLELSCNLETLRTFKRALARAEDVLGAERH